MSDIELFHETVLMSPLELMASPNNAAIHDETQIQNIINSFYQFGFIGAVYVGSNNRIIAGHGRVQAAIVCEMDQIPVIDVSHLSEDEQDAFMVVDNKIAEQKTWDEEMLNSEITRLKSVEIDFDAFGIVEKVLADFQNAEPEHGERPGKIKTDQQWDRDEDEDGEDDGGRPGDEYDQNNLNPRDLEISEKSNALPETFENRVKIGQVWKLNDHRLICGDSTEVNNIEKLFEKKTADFCFTSPPYSDQRTYNGGKELSTEKLAKFISITAECVDLFAVNLGMSRKNFEIVCYWDDYILAARNAGLKLLSWNIWSRSNSGYTIGQATAMFAIDHEWIFVFGKKAKKLNRTVRNKGAGKIENSTRREMDGSTVPSSMTIQEFRQIGTILELNQARNGGDQAGHPAVFPVELPRVYIEACTNPGETVYEPFGGSGTTLIACEESNRKCLISELDPKYCDMILARWEKFTGNAAVLEFDPPVVELRKA